VRRQTGGCTSEAQRDYSRAFFFDALAVGVVTPETVDHVVRHAVTAGDATTAVGEAVRGCVGGVSTETLAHAHTRCIFECDFRAAEAVLRIAEAAGVQREYRRAWAASAAVVSHADPRVVAVRHSALQTILAVRRGGLGADAAIAMVDRLISAGAANPTHIELVARGACFTTAEVLDLVARSAAAGVDMSQGTAARLAECVVVEAGTEADKARHFFEQAAATTTATPAIATKPRWLC
jgi:hypothetical protein